MDPLQTPPQSVTFVTKKNGFFLKSSLIFLKESQITDNEFANLLKKALLKLTEQYPHLLDL